MMPPGKGWESTSVEFTAATVSSDFCLSLLTAEKKTLIISENFLCICVFILCREITFAQKKDLSYVTFV